MGEGIYYRDVGKELLWQRGSHQPPMAVFIILNMDRNRILSILKLIKSLKMFKTIIRKLSRIFGVPCRYASLPFQL